MPTVRIRCGAKSCNRVIEIIGDGQNQEFPSEGHYAWTDPARVAFIDPCPKHGGMRGTLDEVNAERESRGVPEVDVSTLKKAIPWSELRSSYVESTRRGAPVDFVIGPWSRSM